MTDEGFLSVEREDFRKLESLVRDRVVNSPTYVSQLISSRQEKIGVLRKNLHEERRLLQSGCLKDCNPLQTFAYLTDLACFYLEYNFPSSLFKELLIEKLKYSEDAYEDLRLRLLTPCDSAYLTYYRAVLKLALQKLSNVEIDLHYFRQEFACIGDRELRSRSERELEEAIERIVCTFGSRLSLHHELMKMAAVQEPVRAEHARIKRELFSRCQSQGSHITDVVSRLSDMLIDAALENEQTSIWRGRVFVYLNDIIGSLDMNPRTVSVEDIQSKIYDTRSSQR